MKASSFPTMNSPRAKSHNRSTVKCLSYIISLGIGFLLVFGEQNLNKLNTSDPPVNSYTNNNEKKNIKLRRSSRDEPQLPAESEEMSPGGTISADIGSEIEQISRVFPIWIDKRPTASPYDWCVTEPKRTKADVSPKGLLFVKPKKVGSSTAAGVTLRIRDGLSRRLKHLDENAPSDCFAHVRHDTARNLNYQKRDPSQSFLWSIVREPAQRTLSHYFFFSTGRMNYTATEDKILAALQTPKGRNYQSGYLDLPSQNDQSSSSTDRIINGYDFLAVNERMEESLVVLAMLAQIPLADVVIFSSKIAGGYYFNEKRCVKLKKKWTTPKIEEYILGDYKSENKDDYLLYNAAQRSLDKTIDALGRQRVEENIELLKNLQQLNEKQCESEATVCPEPDDERLKRKHIRLANKRCYFSDVGCGHACTDKVLAEYAEKEWLNITSSFGQG